MAQNKEFFTPRLQSTPNGNQPLERNVHQGKFPINLYGILFFQYNFRLLTFSVCLVFSCCFTKLIPVCYKSCFIFKKLIFQSAFHYKCGLQWLVENTKLQTGRCLDLHKAGGQSNFVLPPPNQRCAIKYAYDIVANICIASIRKRVLFSRFLVNIC